MTRKVDVAVIGSGASGSVLTYELARRGASVVVLEAGAREDPTTFVHHEAAMLPRLYKSGGLQTTRDNDLAIGQGRTVGGSTVINNAIWLRAKLDRILPAWKDAGATVPKSSIEAAYEELERVLHVEPLPPDLANKGTNLFLKGCENAGVPARYLNHNRKQCTGCGWCNYGCQYNRKTSMLVTFIPWAEALGAEVLDRCDDVRIQTQGKQAKKVTCYRNGEEVTVEAGKVVVCAGAIGSSAVLLQSGIDLDQRVGKGLHVLGGALMSAEAPEPVDGFDGIGLTCVACASDSYVIETYFAPPLVFAIGMSGWFLTHFRRMMRFAYYSNAGVMVGTQPTGTVSLDKKKRVRIDLKFSKDEIAELKKGLRRLAEIYFAGGAVRVIPATYKDIAFETPDDIDQLDEKVHRPDDLLLGSGHPQGGNRMNEDPKKGVVGNDFRVHGFDNLFVADASVFPTNIWANCQATVMAMAHYAATFVAA